VTGIEPATSGLLDQRRSRLDNQAPILHSVAFQKKNFQSGNNSSMLIFLFTVQGLNELVHRWYKFLSESDTAVQHKKLGYVKDAPQCRASIRVN